MGVKELLPPHGFAGFWRRLPQAPDDFGLGQHRQQVVRQVDFPPAPESLAGAVLVEVVVVVPAFSHGEKGEEPPVAAVVPRLRERLVAVEVCH